MKHGIVIPCYNESSRLDLTTFIDFARRRKDTTLCFVNDGSADMTRSTLAEIKNLVHDNTFVFHIELNGGKANAVRQGALFLFEETEVDTIGFIDADLSTSFEDYDDLIVEMEAINKLKVVFGSRNMGGAESAIERNPIRKILSNIVKVMIYMITRLRIADTQCGAKTFKRELIPIIYRKTFISRWLFDVEILLRLKKEFGKPDFLRIFKEKPLKKWIHMEGSKINWKDTISIPLSLTKIWIAYELKPAFKFLTNRVKSVNHEVSNLKTLGI